MKERKAHFRYVEIDMDATEWGSPKYIGFVSCAPKEHIVNVETIVAAAGHTMVRVWIAHDPRAEGTES